MIYGHIAGLARYGSGSLPAQSSGRISLPLMRLGEDPNGCKPVVCRIERMIEMKSNSEKALKELVWRTANEFARQNLKIMMVVLHDDFGFGRDRLHKVIDCMKEKVRYYDEYDHDGILDYALDRDIRGLGLDDDLTEFLTENIGSRCRNRKIKPKEKDISIAEAAEMRSKMRAFEQMQQDTYAGVIGK